MLQQAVLRLVTLNCLWRGDARARLRAIAAELERRDADVVCLQEVVWRRNARLVRELTPSYPFIAYRPMAPFGVMGGLVTLARHPIVCQEFTVYRTRGRLTSRAVADRMLRKGWLTTSIQLPTQPIDVINTHLLANYDEDWSLRNDYARQLRSELGQVLDGIKAIDRTHAVVVAGDLNVPADTELFADFVGRLGLIDGYELAGARPATVQGRQFAVDHVLVRPPAGARAGIETRIVLDSETRLADGRWSRLSDHNGLEATVRIARRAR